ncbi:DUF6262 family protein [Pseudonocardia sp. TRM90224]|uniref:DUF6262 family protein n=1 Tax=Pseudonocardia sp. TRM90224 TaxID=2812678 RepID=UPI001E4F02DD|nr:DUF6262 family protein [Pseudonocardia sp. TRM90224]
MTRPEHPRTEHAVDGLRRHARERSADARAAIEQALRELRRQHRPINVNAVARRAGVSRKTIYHHTDLLERIRKHRPQLRAIPREPATKHNPIIAALRNDLSTQKSRYEAEITRLKHLLRQRDDELAAVHGELHRQLTRARPTRRPDGAPPGS